MMLLYYSALFGAIGVVSALAETSSIPVFFISLVFILAFYRTKNNKMTYKKIKIK